MKYAVQIKWLEYNSHTSYVMNTMGQTNNIPTPYSLKTARLILLKLNYNSLHSDGQKRIVSLFI